MKLLEQSNQKLDERSHIWVTVDIKNLPSTILINLAIYATDEETLAILADTSNISVRLQVAKNIHTGKKTLTQLAKDPIIFVKEEVAQNPNTPKEVLAELSKDEDMHVRIAATSNLYMPVPDLILRLFDFKTEVIVAAIQNPMTPIENIRVLEKTDDKLVAYEVKRRLAMMEVSKKESIKCIK